MTDSLADLMSAHQDQLTGLGMSKAHLPLLSTYVTRLLDANQRVNLVSRRMSPNQIMRDHLIDSLLPVPYFPNVERVVDLGSGGGFPAIPLAVRFPKVSFFLVEKSPVKRKFLSSLVDVCPNITVLPFYEDAPLSDHRHLIVARAFKSVRDILTLTRTHFRSGGAYMLYKGRRDKIDAELAAAGNLIGRVQVRVQRLASPCSETQRHLVWIPSTAAATSQFRGSPQDQRS